MPPFKSYFDPGPYALAQHWASVKQTTSTREDCSHLVTVVRNDGRDRVNDVVPVVDGKACPDASLRAELAAFAKRPICR